MAGRTTKTAYARMNERNKREAAKKRRLKTNPTKVEAKAAGKCGAKTRYGGICKNTAGMGTTHFGIGSCKYHGGNLANHTKHAAKQQAIMLGAPKDIDPVQALLWCIKITAGEVEWFTKQLETVETAQWFEETLMGRQLHILARARADAINRLAKYSADAIKLGIAERAVRIAELYGTSIANLLKGVLQDLVLTEDQQKRVPEIIKRHLILLESGTLTGEIHKPSTEQPALPKRVAA